MDAVKARSRSLWFIYKRVVEKYGGSTAEGEGVRHSLCTVLSVVGIIAVVWWAEFERHKTRSA